MSHVIQFGKGRTIHSHTGLYRTIHCYKELYTAKQRYTYISDMNKGVAKVLFCDHTPKTSKHVGVTPKDDGKFVCQFKMSFLG